MDKLHPHETLIKHPLYSELDMMLQCVRAAGQIARKVREKGYAVWNKNEEEYNPVTEADKAANEHLIIGLEKAFPQDIIISEEAALPETVLENSRVWFVDPIDGTKEFIKGINEWSVMVGLSIDGKPDLGIVYQPDLDQVYYALADGGAFFCDGSGHQKLKVRAIEDIKFATLIQSRSHWCERARLIAEKYGIHNSIQHGSLGLKLGLIARGEANLYLNFSCHCHLWDICGPAAIFNEAGGIIINSHGEPFNFHTIDTQIKQPFLAAHPLIAAKLYKHLDEVR